MKSEIETKFWKGVGEVAERPENGPIPDFDRRDFLKASGFAVGATLFAGCQKSQVEKAIPYLGQPEGIVAGRSYRIATTCDACTAGCGLLVKCRDGRPIKMEGLPEHPLSRGGVCAVGQASILPLYDSLRLSSPLRQGRESSWSEIDSAVAAKLAEIRSNGGKVRLLTSTIHSPTARAAIERFVASFSDARHLSYDALSTSAILDAHARTHGVRILPRYRFDKASVIAAFDADFLGTWISPMEYTAGWRSGRNLSADQASMSWHVQFEGRMSLTGSNADERVRIRPSQSIVVLRWLEALIDARLQGRSPAPRDLEGGRVQIPRGLLNRLADGLWGARGRGLVISGSQDVEEQIVVNRINEKLGNYGASVDLAAPSLQRTGDDGALLALIDEVRSGSVDVLLVARANPVYDLPFGDELGALLGRVPLVVSFATSRDETAELAHYVCPEPHFLEAWSDAEPVDGVVAVAQPAIRPLGDTRTFFESLSRWAGDARDARQLVMATWEERVAPRATSSVLFQAFWDSTLERGYAEVAPRTSEAPAFEPAAIASSIRLADSASATGAELVLYPKVGLLDGRHAENPWLQELPDPVTKVTWDNYASLSVATAERLGLVNGDVVRVSCDGEPAIELPAFVQPGQHDDVVAIALGYGRRGTERFSDVGPRWIFRRRTVERGERVGVRAAALLDPSRGTIRPARSGARIEKTGRRRDLASTQLHHDLAVPERLAPEGGVMRPIVQQTTFAAWQADARAGRPAHHGADRGLWKEHTYKTHHWAMAIDLTACTGCSACVISCQAENNVPVVGKDEVLRSREMHWIRIDRYYEGGGDDVSVVHQPMMCHHCDNAPCETVCPVLATVHSSEGLNQQVYNRCVGTRYCANNCPYKTRRFNWFDYPREDRLANLVLNPDVTVRSRGVMEKCSLCVQRIQDAKAEAKIEKRPLRDGEIRTACQESCPARAIVFGDANDPQSEISKVLANPRHYRIFEELNIRPSVGYLRLVRNREDRAEEIGHA